MSKILLIAAIFILLSGCGGKTPTDLLLNGLTGNMNVDMECTIKVKSENKETQ